MKINLRKASALQLEIQAVIRGLNLTSLAKVNLNEYEDIDSQIRKAAVTFKDASESKNALINALYTIRKAVANANNSVGISSLLADIALTEMKLKDKNELATVGERHNIVLIQGKMERIKASETASMYSSREVTTSILSADFINATANEASELKRDKQMLQDKLLELNIKTEIDLSDDITLFLKSYNIL